MNIKEVAGFNLTLQRVMAPLPEWTQGAALRPAGGDSLEF